MTQLIILTGASAGFGRSLALTFAKSIKGPKHFILSGRNAARLDSVTNELLSHSTATDSIVCDQSVFDFSNQDLTLLQSQIDRFLSPRPIAYSKVYLFNNSGSLVSCAIFQIRRQL